MRANFPSHIICHKLCFKTFLLTVLIKCSKFCFSNTLRHQQKTWRRPCQGAVNAAAEVGKLTAFKPQFSCCIGLLFTFIHFWLFLWIGRGQGHKDSCILMQPAPLKYHHMFPPEIFHMSLSCCWREGTGSVCLFWQVFPLVQLWKASAGEWSSPLLNEGGALKTLGWWELEWVCIKGAGKVLLLGVARPLKGFKAFPSSLPCASLLAEWEEDLNLRGLSSPVLCVKKVQKRLSRGGSESYVPRCFWCLCSLFSCLRWEAMWRRRAADRRGQFSNDCLEKRTWNGTCCW